MLSRPLLDRIAFFGVSWYALLIVGAVVVGMFIANAQARRERMPEDLIVDFLLYAIPLAVVGARLYYVFFRFADYRENLLSILNIREGGLAIYGGILGGLIAARFVSKKHGIRLTALLDLIAPSLVLGQAIGRWGNYINMEAYGLRVAQEELQFFPFAVEISIGGVWYWHMATFFYEFCWNLVVFALLLLVRSHRQKTGDVFCWYVLLYCAGRTVIEGLRSDSLTFLSEFVRISQIVSALAALLVVTYFFLRIRDRISVVTVAPLVSAVLCLVPVLLGEFERGAYNALFAFSQLSLVVLLVSQLAILLLWTLDSGAFDWKVALPLLLDGVFVAALLAAGMGRANSDNTYYVTLRQCAAMLEFILCGWMLCYCFGSSPSVKHHG